MHNGVHSQVKKQAEEKYPGDEASQQQMIERNPFKGAGACTFKAVASKKKGKVHGGKLFSLSATSNLEHSSFCPVHVGKVKSKMLEREAGFMLSLAAHGWKTSAKVMTSEAGKYGLGGTGISAHVVGRLQRKHRTELNEAYEKQFAELPRYLLNLANKGNAQFKIVSDDDGTLKYAVVAFPAVCEALRVGGRQVASTDFGHMQHDLFGGLNATGLFQLGDGRLVAPWAAIFADANESVFMWEACAKAVKDEFHIHDLYDKAVHFRDRHKGADRFEAILNVEWPM